MKSVAIIGATGNLGQHVSRQALELGWRLSIAVRNRSRVTPEIAARAQITDLDLSTATNARVASFIKGHDAFIFCAGVVSDGESFVRLFDKAVTAVEMLCPDQRPTCWFLAGAGILPIDGTGRTGVDLPVIRDRYWPHRENYKRLQRSDIDWRLLCPGPMVHRPAIGLRRLRLSIDKLPAELPSIVRRLPAPLLVPLFALKIPEMIVPYADASSVILANMDKSDAMSGKRIGVALPLGMKGKKERWAAK